MHTRLLGLFLFLAICLFAPTLGLAQDAGVPVSADPPWLALVLTVLGAIAGSGFLSTFLSSNSWWMKILDAVALNFGKARNDPKVQ